MNGREKAVYRNKLLRFAYESIIFSTLISILVFLGPDLGKVGQNSLHFADFVHFYRMGQIVLSEDRKRIYEPAVQTKYLEALHVLQPSNEIFYAQNPPFFFLMLAPFATLPIEAAFKLWIALSTVCGSAAIAMFLKTAKNSEPRLTAVIIAAAIASSPGWLALAVGQTSWFMLAIISMYFRALLLKKDLNAGLFLALSLCKFQYTPFLAIPMIAACRWKVLLSAGAALILLLIIPAFVLGWQNILNYPQSLFLTEATNSYSGVFPEQMICIRGLLSNIMDRKTALLVSVPVMLAGLLALYSGWRQALSDGSGTYRMVAVTILAALVFSLHTHIYDALFIALAAAALKANACEKKNDEQPAKPFSNKFFLTVLLASYPLASWIMLVATINCDIAKRIPFLIYDALLLTFTIRTRQKQ